MSIIEFPLKYYDKDVLALMNQTCKDVDLSKKVNVRFEISKVFTSVNNNEFLISGMNGYEKWSFETGEGVEFDTVQQKYPTTIRCYSHNGKMILSTSMSQIIIWDVETDKRIKVLSEVENIQTCSFSHDDRMIVSGSEDGNIRIWDIESGKCLHVLKGQDVILSCSFSPNDKMIVSSSENDEVKIWDVESGKCIRTIRGSRKGKECDEEDDKGEENDEECDEEEEESDEEENDEENKYDEYYGTYRFKNPMKIDNGEKKAIEDLIESKEAERSFAVQNVHEPKFGYTDLIYSCSFSPNNEMIIIGGCYGTVTICDVKTGKLLRTVGRHHEDIKYCSFIPNTNKAISLCNDGIICIWDWESGETFKTLKEKDEFNYFSHCSLSQDGKFIITASQYGIIRRIDVDYLLKH